MSAQEAAEYAGVHVKTVYGWIERGYLKAKRWGRAYAIEKRDIDKLLVDPPKPGRPRKAK